MGAEKKELPEGWEWIELGDIGLYINGKAFKPKDWSAEGLPIIRIANLNNKKARFNYCNFDVPEKFHVKNGDLLFAWSGTPGTSFGAHLWYGEEAVLNQHIFRVEHNSEIIEKAFFKYALDFVVDDFINQAHGTAGLAHITKKKFIVTSIPLPPLPEQQRIVAKLDSLMGQVERLRTALARVPDLLVEFRQSVLHQAVTGRLTADWREGKELEKVDLLFQRIIQKRKKIYDEFVEKARQKGERKPRKILLDNLPVVEDLSVKFPESWNITNIEFLAHVTKLAGFEYTKHFDLKPEGEIPVVRAQNVQMGQFVPKNLLYISKEISDELERSKLHGREILMVFIGAGTGNVCLAPKEGRWHLAPNVAKIDVDGILPEYVFRFLQSPVGLDSTLSHSKATAQQSLSMTTIRQIVVLVPSLPEQTEIVRRVESLFAKADAIEARYQSLQAIVDTLPQALLAKAFRGELVPQLPGEGHARDLLAEITRLREKA